jgi:hypothetical protein
MKEDFSCNKYENTHDARQDDEEGYADDYEEYSEDAGKSEKPNAEEIGPRFHVEFIGWVGGPKGCDNAREEGKHCYADPHVAEEEEEWPMANCLGNRDAKGI